MGNKRITDKDAQRLLSTYRDHARPLLEEHQFKTLESLDQTASLLEDALRLPETVHIGFVGESQVGKSSLINALLGRRALPAGGIGPLTAQPTRINHATENRLEACYHGTVTLNRLRFGIESYLVRRHELVVRRKEEPPDEALAEVEVQLEQDLPPPDEESDEPPRSSSLRSEVGEHMLNQARLMLIGKEADENAIARTEILDAVRVILGQAPHGDPTRLESFKDRINHIRSLLGTSEVLSENELERREFNRALRARAADWMSPLVKSLTLHLNVPLLERVHLVDLPGIGVVGDAAAEEAERFVRNEGDAIVLVMKNSGLVDGLAQLLERSGVVTKLLFGDRDGHQAIRVIIAVTHLDDVAFERHRVKAQEAREDDLPVPSRGAVFAEAAAQMDRTVRAQVRDHLLGSEAFAGLEADQREHREAIVHALCETMDVICVSALDYLDLQNGDDPRFLNEVTSTGIPALQDALDSVGASISGARQDHVRESYVDLRHGMLEHLILVTQLYQEGGGLATVEWDQFRKDLANALERLRPEMTAHHGETIGFLRHSLPERIENLCLKAENTTLRRLSRIRRRAEDLRWPSLNAALVRKGKWERQSLDYPGDLTRSMVDAIASDWEPTIVEGVRKAVQTMANRDLRLVEKLCDVANEHDDRIVGEAHIAAQKTLLQQQSRNCVRWTRDRLDGLRENVQEHLSDVVLEPIAMACKRAVDRDDNQGRGATRRIVEAFQKGGAEAITSAKMAAQKLLLKHYEALFRELDETYLAKHHDPLDAAFQALTNEELGRARRSDAQRRRHVLRKVATIREQLGVQ